MRKHPRHQVQRIKDRAHYDRAQVNAILDAGWVAHVAFCVDGQPFVIPMLYAREGDALLLHGSIASRLQRTLGEGCDVCVCVTLIDGLVLARSHFHHSMNYRSVVAFGKATEIHEPLAKAVALSRFVDTLIPGRSSEARPADTQELAATSVLLFNMEDVSAKIRNAGAKDNASDYALPFWAGVVPTQMRYGTPQPAADLPSAIEIPASVQRLLAT